MPPYLDIYVATNDRSLACIERFLAQYADLTVDAVRDDFEVRPTGEQEGFVSGTLAATLAYGLAQAERAFTLYFQRKHAAYRCPMLYFSPHGRLLLGLAVEETSPTGQPNEAEAARVLQRLQQEFGTEHGLIAWELTPRKRTKNSVPLCASQFLIESGG